MSAARSQYVPERAKLVDDPVCDARPLFLGPQAAGWSVSTAPISQVTENRRSFAAGLEGVGFWIEI